MPQFKKPRVTMFVYCTAENKELAQMLSPYLMPNNSFSYISLGHKIPGYFRPVYIGVNTAKQFEKLHNYLETLLCLEALNKGGLTITYQGIVNGERGEISQSQARNLVK